ncbi:MAG: hypothetical protein AUJ92_17200 [Armatimonadetes bacterium CG2_30_59_28]|nr:hypothetical protein [Armatimonadota bacterium]OIO91086.1 MAG: hypothetical protein AUJ92_17200 [Armatimonadetes bacterium CG2_30_59_28]PIU64092.1 MAG: hypothetical protein COS85_13920 [Armatimonadetes bacterium CG07_land_8_20_14_0_80_59_28]PIY43286.1 MAG: hypothetical protein COZ05_11490 [Armatimonadetes bacterium CG_4_10_14_3_um_filter_59_10]PJB69297.1 MAG: hypothetical protein CO095_10125 [Armatimonadetes bacterium CG_4_9_14_3_um_filter_58_7]
MNTTVRCLVSLLIGGLLAGCGQVIKTEAPTPPPTGPPTSPEPEQTVPSPEEVAPADEEQAAIQYDPRIDLELMSAGLSRAKLSAQGDNFAEMGSELRNVGSLLGYIESHLSSVVLDVGSQRVGLRLEQNDLRGAGLALQQMTAEIDAVNALSENSDLQVRLTDLETSLVSGDTAKAKELVGQLSSIADDPAYGYIQSIRGALLGATDAALRQPPKKRVVLAELESVGELIAAVRQGLDTPVTQPSVPSATTFPPAAATRLPGINSGPPPVSKVNPAPLPPVSTRTPRRPVRRRAPGPPRPAALPVPADSSPAQPSPPPLSTPRTGKAAP